MLSLQLPAWEIHVCIPAVGVCKQRYSCNACWSCVGMSFPYIWKNCCLILWPQMNKILVLCFHRNVRKDWPFQLKGLSNPVTFVSCWKQLPGMRQAWDSVSHVLYQLPVICSSGPDVVSLYLIPPQGFSTYEFIQAFLEARQASSFHHILHIVWRSATTSINFTLFLLVLLLVNSEESFPIHFPANCFALKIFSLLKGVKFPQGATVSFLLWQVCLLPRALGSISGCCDSQYFPLLEKQKSLEPFFCTLYPGKKPGTALGVVKLLDIHRTVFESQGRSSLLVGILMPLRYQNVKKKKTHNPKEKFCSSSNQITPL